jgi:hypothetical protein
MLDFTPVRHQQLSLKELVERENLSSNDLRTLTNEMIDRMLDMIAHSTDADVTFVPSDPGANDTFAINPDEVDLAWTLGHVIVHTTASSEEAAFLAAEVGRGVEWRGGRARYEVPWRSVTTIQQCRDRLEESRRMRLASLDLWPQPPHVENTYEPRAGLTHNCVSRFVAGLMHDDSHLGQIEKIVAQARAAQSTATMN